MKIIDNYRRKKLSNVRSEISYFEKGQDKLNKTPFSIGKILVETYVGTRLSGLKQKESLLLNKLGVQNAN